MKYLLPLLLIACKSQTELDRPYSYRQESEKGSISCIWYGDIDKCYIHDDKGFRAEVWENGELITVEEY